MGATERPAEQEFEQALAEQRRRLFGIAYSILHHPFEAEDALQEVSVQAWKGWQQRSDVEKTKAWLTTICVRHCLRRRQGLLKRLLETSTDRQTIAAATDHLRYEGRYIDLDRAYIKLSRQQRAVIALHYQNG